MSEILPLHLQIVEASGCTEHVVAELAIIDPSLEEGKAILNANIKEQHARNPGTNADN